MLDIAHSIRVKMQWRIRLRESLDMPRATYCFRADSFGDCNTTALNLWMFCCIVFLLSGSLCMTNCLLFWMHSVNLHFISVQKHVRVGNSKQKARCTARVHHMMAIERRRNINLPSTTVSRAHSFLPRPTVPPQHALQESKLTRSTLSINVQFRYSRHTTTFSDLKHSMISIHWKEQNKYSIS